MVSVEKQNLDKTNSSIVDIPNTKNEEQQNFTRDTDETHFIKGKASKPNIFRKGLIMFIMLMFLAVGAFLLTENNIDIQVSQVQKPILFINSPNNSNGEVGLTKPQLSPLPMVSVKDIHDISPQEFSRIKWEKYTHPKYNNHAEGPGWGGFDLYYPSSWRITVSDSDGNAPGPGPVLFLKLTATNGDIFIVSQGPVDMGKEDGIYCLYPDQPEYRTFKGLNIAFTTYAEVKKDKNIVWRLADLPNPNISETQRLCEQFNSNLFKVGYRSRTTIGSITIKVTTIDNINMANEILKKITIHK